LAQVAQVATQFLRAYWVRGALQTFEASSSLLYGF